MKGPDDVHRDFRLDAYWEHSVVPGPTKIFYCITMAWQSFSIVDDYVALKKVQAKKLVDFEQVQIIVFVKYLRLDVIVNSNALNRFYHYLYDINYITYFYKKIFLDPYETRDLIKRRFLNLSLLKFRYLRFWMLYLFYFFCIITQFSSFVVICMRGRTKTYTVF